MIVRFPTVPMRHYPVIPPGTLRPRRLFFAILHPVGASALVQPHSPECLLPCFKLPEKFPFELVLDRGGERVDLGNTGLFNHFEFCRELFKISKNNLTAWQVRGLECNQQSLALHTALSISHDYGAAKEPKASSSAPEANEYAFLECSLLKFGKANTSFAKKHEVDDFDGDGNQSEFDFSDKDDLADLFLDSGDDEGGDGEKRKLSAMEGIGCPIPTPKGESDKKEPSEVGSMRSGHSGHVKTIATQKAVVEEALREIGRPF